MVEVAVDIDQAAVQRIDRALHTIQELAPERIGGSVRRAGIYVLNSLKARTIKAPAVRRKSEYTLNPIKGAYITRRGLVLHQWEFVRLPGTPAETRKVYAAFASRQRVKTARGWRWSGINKAAERQEVINYNDLLRIRRAGLAKLSWGWIASQILGSTNSVGSWQRMRGERRDPRNFVKGLFTRIANVGAKAEIKNSLDYIFDALPPGAIGEALNAASKRLEYNINEEMKKLYESRT